MTKSPAFLKIEEDIKKIYGEQVFRPLQKTDARLLPTGFFAIDYCLGGGLPANRIMELIGHKGCFKTTLALKIIASYQRRCGMCLQLLDSCTCGKREQDNMAIYLDAEHALDENHALRHGINSDPDRFRILQPPYGEVACEYAESLIMVPEVAIMVIDTLADLVPETEMQKGYLDKFARNLRARLIARLSRQMTHKIDRPDRPRFLIFVNHLLPDQDSSYGGSISPGGEEQAYASSTIITLWGRKPEKMTFDKSAEKNEEEEQQKKREVNFILGHHKSRPQAEGAFDIVVADEPELNYGDANDFDAVFNWAVKRGIVNVSGKSKWEYDGQSFPSQKRIRDLWKSSPEKYEQVKSAIIALRK